MRNKKGTIRSKMKQAVSGVIAAAMVAVAFPVLPVHAQTSSATYSFEGYDVEYSVVSQWEDGQTVEVKVTNTGEESIVNWAFLYDAEGTISSIWNAAVVDNKDTKYVIKNDSWNYEIASGQSVNFGYTLTDDDFAAPHDFSLCSGRMNISDGYKVDVNVKSTWDTGVEGELVITNTSDRPLEAWTLDFDTNFTVDNVWDGQLLESGDNHYRIACASWTNPIPVNGSAKIGFTGTKDIGTEPGVNSFALTCVGLDYTFETAAGGSMELIADTDEILAEVSSKTVYFYVFTEEEIPAVSLVDTQTNQVVATLVDDGNYASSGDDMMGDGVYSAKYTLSTNVPEDTVYSYRAVADDKMTSNEISIAVYLPFTEQELDDMEYVDNAILKVLGDNPTPDYLKNIPSEFVQNGYVEDYSNVFEKRYSELIATLEALLVEGKLESYHYDEAGHAFVCRYKSGGEFFIDVDDKLESADMEEPVIIPAITGLYDEYNVLILNTFEDTTFRTAYYEELVKTWRAAGLNVTYDDYVTVLDLKTELLNKDFITLSGHGKIDGESSYFLLFDDKVTRMNKRAYTLDIKAERINGTFGPQKEPYYGVTDSFFTYYYGKGGLSGSFIFSEACKFMGSVEKKGFDDTFASVLVNDCQAEAVVGFYNSVNARYSRDLMTHYFEGLLNGQTAEEAFTYAREMCGYDDFSYQIPTFLEYLTGKDFPEETIVRSVPYLIGDGSAVFMRRFQNGDWESIAQFFHAKPMKWEYMGDARVLSRLGEIRPTGKKMAFLSTGIGSQSGESMSGTQGSALCQTIRNQSGTTLQFDYDFVFEEPMEFVASMYDDKFEVRILDKNDNILYNEILESINESYWYSISGIDFDGGDHTVFHTDWKTKTIDISGYQNQMIQIQFLVYDVGDSAYDSAVVLDNIAVY